MSATPERPLAGKRTIVTGATSGVGMATAELFASLGAKVGLVARRAELLDQLAAKLGEGALPLCADVADDAAVERVVNRAAEAFGGLDIAVNAAGIDGPAPLADLTPEVWRRQIDVNLSGTFYLARQAALHMRTGAGGVIVNLGSELSLVGMGFYAHYCASKFGVVGLTKALAHELAPKVRVNCVCPGPIDTPMMDAELEWFPDPVATRKAAIERVPLKRFATAQEIARTILFIAVDAPFATGSIFSIDGGTTAV
jgi:NAD(P)-dependent dehydrogenase (short-subunit alcohol dehydrogenase family)